MLALAALASTLGTLAGPAAQATTLALRDARALPGMLVGVGTHQLHIHCTGRGAPTVVFEAGLGGTSLDWAKVQPRVSRFTQACSYDRAGYGWSEAGPGPRNAERIAGELEKLLVHASLPPPYVLVGHSFGGLSMRLLAERKADAVAGLVLIDATPERQFERLPAAGIRTPVAPTGRTFVIANHWSIPDGMPAELRDLAQALALRPKAIRALYGELATMRESAIQVRRIARATGSPVAVLARGRVRRTAEAGRLDGAWLQMQRELAGRMPNASVSVVAGSGHHIHLDRPEAVVSSIREMIELARGARRPDRSR